MIYLGLQVALTREKFVITFVDFVFAIAIITDIDL